MQTHTFLFTDIEGSTALFERARVLYPAALARHFAILRTALAKHGGSEFKNSGDGLLAVFASSAAGVACAIACQEALHAEPWPPEMGTLRVRIGLHRGEASPGEGDFHGIVMHHAMRVLNAAHGGQIICSGEVAADLPDEDRARLHDLGLYRLRGVPEPVRIYDVASACRPPDGFPSLRTSPAFEHRIPSPPTRFFGREREIESLRGLLTSAAPPRPTGRLLTVLGPGGMGKTRLALAVAEELLPVYSHAVWFVPLAELRDAQLLPEVLREGLGLPPDGSAPALERVATHLAAQPSLLVLDNFEQLIPNGVGTVAALLEAVPGLMLLVTSRRTLELSAERAFPLPPLPLPGTDQPLDEARRCASVQLFLDRALVSGRDFSEASTALADIAALCRALEGVPLALELAAARAGVLTPRQMLSRIEHQLDFLIGGKRDVSARHQTLRAAVAWSYELLAEPLRITLARLAVFRGGWTLPAAEAVVAEVAGTVLDHLTELVGASLVVAAEDQGEMRFRMLEAIREFAEEQLLARGGADADGAALRHRQYYSGLLASEARAGSEAHRFRVSETEYDNLRAILAGAGPLAERAALAVGLRDFWMVRGWFVEGRAWFEGLLAEKPSPEDQARLANAAGILAWKAGDLASARTHMETAIEVCRAMGNERNVAGMLNNLGILAGDQGDLSSARDYYERSLEIYRRLEAPAELAAALSNLGETVLLAGNPGEARAYLEESLAIQERLGQHFACANTLHNLADLHRALGDCEAARVHLARSLAIRANLGGRDETPASWITLARVALAEGLLRRAVACYAAADQAFWELKTQPAPAQRAELARDLEHLRAALDQTEFTECWRQGRTWDLAQALTPGGAWANGLDQIESSKANSPA